MKRPSPALVVATIALIVALAGTGYAALKLPSNSVGAKQLKRNAVTSPKVKNGSLLASDFKAGQLPAGPKGEKGDNGAPGTNGSNGTNGTNGHDGARGPSNAWEVHRGPFPVLTTGQATVTKSQIEPGEYVAHATVQGSNLSAPSGFLTCTLTAPGASDAANAYVGDWDDASADRASVGEDGTGDQAYVSLSTEVAFTAPDGGFSSVQLTCTSVGNVVDVQQAKIVIVQVGALTKQQVDG